MSVELGLAIVGTIDLCFKYGKILVDLYDRYKSAEQILAEQILRLENIWLRTKVQLDFLKSICSTLDEAHLRIQKQNLDILDAKLKIAASKVEGLVIEDGDELKVKKFKFAVVKEGLDKAIEELEYWQKQFDPSWFLIMKLAVSQVDHALTSQPASNTSVIQSAQSMRTAVNAPTQDQDKKGIFFKESGFQLTRSVSITGSNVQLVQRSGSSKWLLVENVSSSLAVSPSVHEKDVRDIARRLSHANPSDFNLLKCYGVVRHYPPHIEYPSSYTFIFRLPEHVAENSVSSLRGVLRAKLPGHTLSARFRVAQNLARAVSYIHSFGFVHKNIRPETILLLKNPPITPVTTISSTSTPTLGDPFLVGFSAFRSAEGATAHIGDTEWSLNIYRHPSRQGERPSKDYIMQHDIYSLGVCLLELGLFDSFVLGSDSNIQANTALLNLNVSHMALDPTGIKDHLVKLARDELPQRMGTKYAETAVTCLTCLDADNVDFGDEKKFQDEDGIAVGVRYIEKVLGKLNEISV